MRAESGLASAGGSASTFPPGRRTGQLPPAPRAPRPPPRPQPGALSERAPVRTEGGRGGQRDRGELGEAVGAHGPPTSRDPRGQRGRGPGLHPVGGPRAGGGRRDRRFRVACARGGDTPLVDRHGDTNPTAGEGGAPWKIRGTQAGGGGDVGSARVRRGGRGPPVALAPFPGPRGLSPAGRGGGPALRARAAPGQCRAGGCRGPGAAGRPAPEPPPSTAREAGGGSERDPGGSTTRRGPRVRGPGREAAAPLPGAQGSAGPHVRGCWPLLARRERVRDKERGRREKPRFPRVWGGLGSDCRAGASAPDRP